MKFYDTDRGSEEPSLRIFFLHLFLISHAERHKPLLWLGGALATHLAALDILLEDGANRHVVRGDLRELAELELGRRNVPFDLNRR